MKIKQFLLLLLVLAIALPAVARKKTESLPLDKAVRIGKLSNGLTYYIRHNREPENKVNFYIAQKVGSIQEEDNQRGLAHFLEHMCFNGTEHFPGKGLINYLETIGVKFGVNLNAYTLIEETVYNINDVPVNTAGAIDSCLWILRDWADGLTLDGEEIDKERGVIHEEWRGRSSAMTRMLDVVLPIAYQGEKYAYRMPIGTMEIVDNFPHQALRDYYEKWYRPDLQGIIIVGDIDVDAVEKKVKKIFKKIKKAKNPAERIYYPVSDNEELIFAEGSDEEQQAYALQLYYKHDATPREKVNTREHVRTEYILQTTMSLFNARIAEITQKENPPFLGAGVSYGNFILSSTKDAFSVSVMSATEKINEALAFAYCEVERARRYGFTEGELARQKASSLAALESWYAEREKTTNNKYADDYIRHFLDNSPMLSAEDEYKIMKEIIEKTTIEDVNSVLPSLIRKENRVAISLAPKKDSVAYPTKEQLVALLDAVEKIPLTPYVDTMNNSPLLEEEPEGNAIIAEEDGEWGTTVWTLPGGIKVVVKPTDYAANQVILKGYSYGGTGRYPDSDRVSLNVLKALSSIGGAGSFDAMQLNKKLAGSTAKASVDISTYLDQVSATCAPDDIEDMFRLLYLKFTAPRQDSAAVESYKSRLRTSLRDRSLLPANALNDTINVALYNRHPRMVPMTEADVDCIDYDRVIEIYKDRTSDASDFLFTIVGNVDAATIKPLVEKYIGGLPLNGRKETLYDHGLGVRKGIYRNNFARKMETPTGTEVIFISGDIEPTLRNSVLMSYLSQIMSLVYTSEVREKEGGTYGVGVYGNVTRLPKGEFDLSIQFNMAPERREELTKIILDQLHKVADEGPKDEYIEKVRSYMLKKMDEQEKSNEAWNNWLFQYYFHNVDNYTTYRDTVNSITKDDIKKFLTAILEQGNMIEVSMVPEK